jgi:hypothetical protein
LKKIKSTATIKTSIFNNNNNNNNIQLNKKHILRKKNNASEENKNTHLSGNKSKTRSAYPSSSTNRHASAISKSKTTHLPQQTDFVVCDFNNARR